MGAGCRGFESLHSDQNFDRKQRLFSAFGHLLLFWTFRCNFLREAYFSLCFLRFGLFYSTFSCSCFLVALVCGYTGLLHQYSDCGGAVCQKFLEMGAKKQQTFFKIYCLCDAVMGGGIKLPAVFQTENCSTIDLLLVCRLYQVTE